MFSFRKFAFGLLTICCLALASPNAARAQQAEQTPAAEADGADPYYYLATTVGAVGGLIAGALITDGIIVPAYVWTTGSSWWVGSGTAGTGMAAAASQGARMARPAAYAWSNIHGPVVWTIRVIGRVGGAVTGGVLGAGWYEGAQATGAAE